MIEICPKDQCTGCGMCAGACPKQCITMSGDTFGFIHPVIDNDVCIDCGLCQKRCPNNAVVDFTFPKKAFAAWSLDEVDRQTSTLGGIGSVLASTFINNGGVVYGAVGSGCGNVVHKRAATIEDSLKFKTSKYVQSYVSPEIYRQIKSDLKSGRRALFIGTPCQVAGVKSCIGKNELLFSVDIICHGVPSQKILQNHLSMVLGKKYPQVTAFSTRESEGHFLTCYAGPTVIYRKPLHKDAYLNGFHNALFYRESCYQCKYARPERQSDLTIGDFWGLGECSYPKKKVSVILLNSNAGSTLLNLISNSVFLDERDVWEAIDGNNQLKKPSKRHKYYNLFRFLYPKVGYRIAVKASQVEFRIKYAIHSMLMRSKPFHNWYINKSKK